MHRDPKAARWCSFDGCIEPEADLDTNALSAVVTADQALAHVRRTSAPRPEHQPHDQQQPGGADRRVDPVGVGGPEQGEGHGATAVFRGA